jgi:hypothetical protein
MIKLPSSCSADKVLRLTRFQGVLSVLEGHTANFSTGNFERYPDVLTIIIFIMTI